VFVDLAAELVCTSMPSSKKPSANGIKTIYDSIIGAYNNPLGCMTVASKFIFVFRTTIQV
jgi:hypothetical protein